MSLSYHLGFICSSRGMPCPPQINLCAICPNGFVSLSDPLYIPFNFSFELKVTELKNDG